MALPSSPRSLSAAGPARLAAAALLALSLPLLSACQDRLAVRGQIVDDENIAALEPGELTAETIRGLLGTPSSRRALLGAGEGETWLYVGERTSQRTFKDVDVLERRILVLHFGSDGFLAGSELLDLEDARQIVPRALTTPTPGRQFTIWQQFLGNLGRFNTPQPSPAP